MAVGMELGVPVESTTGCLNPEAFHLFTEHPVSGTGLRAGKPNVKDTHLYSGSCSQ